MVKYNFVKSVWLGILASLVPITLLSGKGEDISTLLYLPVVFILINVIGLYIVQKVMGVQNPFAIGALMSFFPSTLGRLTGIPQRVFKMDPNLFQAYAFAVWSMYYPVIFYLVDSVVDR